MSKIIVIGSSNTDMVIKCEKLPLPGETVLGGTFIMNPGGKGANQAVSAARLGGKAVLVAKTGMDMFGEEMLKIFSAEKIDTRYIVRDPYNPSGVALINVDRQGENSIVVAPGSNGTLSGSDISEDLFNETDAIFLMQLEIPLETVIYSAKKAYNKGNRIVLNPAPACTLPDELLKLLYLITPNETEASFLTGINVADQESAERSALILRSRGVKNVIITLGASGAYLLSERSSGMVPGIKVQAVDTTAAGDVFNGALAVALSEGMEIPEAVHFANKAASLSVTRMGAQASAPFRHEID